ncbi:hypothetical protein J2Z65_000062 [Paenibacillus aceris]|uniref:DUF420 domain-containing protein n=1 Tax=Paenibacillus aceris TaxID=869555 RepID=A0ABS4HQI0_9BACL|nr:hypothetical protein [Paenibacillus aceris]
MKKRKALSGLLACVSILFVLYALVDNYFIDPRAEGFSNHKIGLKRELNLLVWLNVMHVHVAFACIAMVAGLTYNHYGARTNQKETDRQAPKLDDPKLSLLLYEYVDSSHHRPFSSWIRSHLRCQLYDWRLRLYFAAAGHS